MSKILIDEDTVKLVLEALKQIDNAMPFPVAKLAQAALREALADQPAQQEPFGYFKAEPFGWTDCAETDEGAVALYTAPQPTLCAPAADGVCESLDCPNHKPAQRDPLTDEEILNFGPGQPDAVWSYEDQLYFARAIEAAHNIKENT